jgi:hypothetical protein
MGGNGRRAKLSVLAGRFFVLISKINRLRCRAGTAAYFAARAQHKALWRETGRSDRANIVLIGEQHFDENVNQACHCLRKLAAKHADSELPH